VGARFQEKEGRMMRCVICKVGEVKPGRVEAEIRLGSDRLLVSVEAEVCNECGEAYYSTETMRYLERVREDFLRKAIAPAAVGSVYHV
jgi:YgiT-type zinc finger domain-containing protein